MATTLFTLPTSVIQNGQGVAGWLDPNNILLVDNKFAVATGPASVLEVGNFNLNIPQGSSITNFTVQIKGYRGSYNTTLQIYAVDDTTGVSYAYPMTPFQGFSGSNTLFTLPSTLFGTTWTVDQANNIKLRFIADGELHLDACLIQADYVPTVTPTPVTPSTGQVVVDEFVEAIRFNLAQSITASDLYVFLQSFNLPDGTPIQYADFWGEADLVIDQGIPGYEEQVIITNVEHNYQGTGLVRLSFGTIQNRGLKFIYPYDHDITLCRPHDANAQIVISNSARFYSRFLKKNQIDALVSAPIYVLDEGVQLPIPVHSIDVRGAGAQIANDGVDPFKKILTVPGNGINPPYVVGTPTSATTGGSMAPTLTWNHTSQGTNRGILVQISSSSSETVTGVTFNGVALTQLASDVNGSVRSEQWLLIAPPVGTYAIVITMSGNAYITAGAETYNSLKSSQTGAATNTAIGNGLSPSVTLNTTADNSIVVDSLATQLLPMVYTAGAGQAESWHITANPNAAQGASSVEPAGTAPDSVVMDWAITQSTDWVMTAVELLGIPGPSASDEKVKATSADTTPGYLDQKLQAGANITFTVINPGANEKIEIAASGGGGGTGNNLLTDQTPDNGTYGLLAGSVNGSNTTFTVSSGQYVSGSLVVYLNGLVQLQGASDDWQETSPGIGTFDFNTAPQVGDIITVTYQTTGGGVGAQAGIQFEDEGTPLGSAGTVDEFDVTGSGGTLSRVGNKVTLNIPGSGGGGSLPGGFSYLPLGKLITAGGGDGEDVGNNVFVNAGTNRIYCIVGTGNNPSLRIFKNDFGTYYVENEITVDLSMLSLTTGTGISEVSWTSDDNYLYAMVNYEKSTATTFQRIDVLRFDLDGTNPIATNVFAQSPTVTNARNYVSWDTGLSNREYRACTTYGTSLFTTWAVRTGASTYTYQLREYTISGTTYTLINTYTMTSSNNTDQAFNLRYDPTNNCFYFGGLNNGSNEPLIDKFVISGPNIAWDSQKTYREFGYGNNHPSGVVNEDYNISSVVDQVTYNDIYVVQQETGSSGSLGASVTSRSYRLFVYKMPKF